MYLHSTVYCFHSRVSSLAHSAGGREGEKKDESKEVTLTECNDGRRGILITTRNGMVNILLLDKAKLNYIFNMKVMSSISPSSFASSLQNTH